MHLIPCIPIRGYSLIQYRKSVIIYALSTIEQLADRAARERSGLEAQGIARLINRLLGARAAGLRSKHLLAIAIIMAGLGYVYYSVDIAFRELYVILFFYPLIYAAIVYRLRGAFIGGAVFIAILLPRVLPGVYEPEVMFRSLVLATFPFLIGGLVATQLNYLEQRLEAFREILELNEELNLYIVQLESTQKQLIHAERLNAIGQLSASIAHEINNPLAGVLIYTRLLAKKLTGGPLDRTEGLEVLGKMEAAVGHCSRIIRGLLDFARQSEPGSAPIFLGTVLDQVIVLIDHQAELSHVEIIREDATALPPVMGEFSQLQQVFLNLTVNAIQAMPEGGKLAIKTTLTNDGWVKVRVQDTGTGIAPENIDKMFTPFFTTKEPGKGVGLGLAISYGIIGRHGGKLEVESTPGQGATFTVSLPAYTYPGEVG